MNARIPQRNYDEQAAMARWNMRQAIANISTAEQFSDWLCAADDDREMSKYFGPISSPALFSEILLNEDASDEQLVAAWKEARQRFLEGKADRIAEELQRLVEQQ